MKDIVFTVFLKECTCGGGASMSGDRVSESWGEIGLLFTGYPRMEDRRLSTYTLSTGVNKHVNNKRRFGSAG
jgi:hypothetical protein